MAYQEFPLEAHGVADPEPEIPMSHVTTKI